MVDVFKYRTCPGGLEIDITRMNRSCLQLHSEQYQAQDPAMNPCSLHRVMRRSKELSELDTRSSCPDINLFTALRLCILQISSIPFLHQSLSEYSPKNPDLQRWRPANQILKICIARDTHPRVAWNCVITYIQSRQVVCITMAENIPCYQGNTQSIVILWVVRILLKITLI